MARRGLGELASSKRGERPVPPLDLGPLVSPHGASPVQGQRWHCRRSSAAGVLLGHPSGLGAREGLVSHATKSCVLLFLWYAFFLKQWSD